MGPMLPSGFNRAGHARRAPYGVVRPYGAELAVS